MKYLKRFEAHNEETSIETGMSWFTYEFEHSNDFDLLDIRISRQFTKNMGNAGRNGGGLYLYVEIEQSFIDSQTIIAKINPAAVTKMKPGLFLGDYLYKNFNTKRERLAQLKVYNDFTKMIADINNKILVKISKKYDIIINDGLPINRDYVDSLPGAEIAQDTLKTITHFIISI